MDPPRFTRRQLVERIRRRLERASSPRFQMTLMVLATACAGFLCSYLLLQLGLYQMWLRYSLSVVVAYAAFLGLIHMWLQASRPGAPSLMQVDINPLDVLNSLDDISLPHASGASAPSGGSTSHGSGLLGFDLDLDGEGLVVVIVVLVTVGVAVIASIYLITQAPSLLAEVLLDGALSFGLYRRLRSLERRHWLESAVARTWFPFFWVLVFFVIAGAVMQTYAPEAVSIGRVWEHLTRAG